MGRKNETPVLSVKNLKQHFTSGFGKNKLVVKAVDGISFDIYKGEVFGLVGESGCGKTTTGRSIIKLYVPTDGEVKFLCNLISAGYMENKDSIKRAKQIAKSKIRSLKHEMSEKIANDPEKKDSI